MAIDGEETTHNNDLVLAVFNDEKESIAEVDFAENQPSVMSFSTRAGSTTEIDVQPNPSFIIQHYLSDFPMIVTTENPEKYANVTYNDAIMELAFY